jgi:hypothetical protein
LCSTSSPKEIELAVNRFEDGLVKDRALRCVLTYPRRRFVSLLAFHSLHGYGHHQTPPTDRNGDLLFRHQAELVDHTYTCDTNGEGIFVTDSCEVCSLTWTTVVEASANSPAAMFPA